MEDLTIKDFNIAIPTDDITESLQRILVWAKTIDKEVRNLGLQNEQWFLDWQDKLNEISVK